MTRLIAARYTRYTVKHPDSFRTQTSMAGGTYSTTAKVDVFCTQVIRRLEALPGIKAASTSILLPMENDVDLPFNIAGKPPEKGGQYNGDEQWRNITPDYFKAFRVIRTTTDPPDHARGSGGGIPCGG
jgi:hypothetical protein